MFNVRQTKAVMLTIKAIQTTKNINAKVQNKIKGTIIGKAVDFLKNVCNDYKEVAISVRQDIREKPKKALILCSGMGLAAFSLTHNPNAQHFRAKYVNCANELALVSPNIVNQKTDQHLKYIQRCYNRDLIRYTSFGLFSIIWIDKYSDQCNLYENNCSYLKLSYREIPSQIIDFGFWNIWWNISRKMLDYDINY